MRRVVSVWLPYWRMERREKLHALTRPLEKRKPLAIVESGKGRRRLGAVKFTARAGMAGTLGAAWALARFGAGNGMWVPEGEEARFIAALPVKGLRIEESDCTLLKRLGLGTIGQLYGLPREALRALSTVEILQAGSPSVIVERGLARCL